MGRPSQRKHSAQRPGKRERARVKRRRRLRSSLHVGGGGTYTLKAGRKKWNEAHVSNNPANPWGLHRYGAEGRCPITRGTTSRKPGSSLDGRSTRTEPGENRSAAYPSLEPIA